MYSLGMMRTQGVCVSSSIDVCRVSFSATRCASNWSKHGSTGGDGPEMGLEWVLEGLGMELLRWTDGLV